jgi:hypothetical protein
VYNDLLSKIEQLAAAAAQLQELADHKLRSPTHTLADDVVELYNAGQFEDAKDMLVQVIKSDLDEWERIHLSLLKACHNVNPHRTIDLTGVDLSGANIQHSSLMCVNLTGANLRNAALHSTDMYGAILRDAILDDALIIATNMTEEQLLSTQSRNCTKLPARLRHLTANCHNTG